MKRYLFLLLILVLAFSLLQPFEAGASDVAQQYGQLRVLNAKLCDQQGNPVQLKGMSSHGLQWFPFTGNTVTSLANDWHINIVRAAMYTNTNDGGYVGNETAMKNQVKMIVDQAIANGIYVIIDWHILNDNNPNTYKIQARAFFEEMAGIYGGYPNVLYEICNEPNNCSWANDIKPYADYVIQGIRAIDPDNIIIIGTENWSSGVRTAADNQLPYANILYTLHFYCGSSGASLRNDAEYAISKGAGIFVTEWGATDYTGGGPLYLGEAQNWTDWMAANKISWCNWSFCNKNEGSAALLPGAGMDGPWPDTQLSESGKLVRAKINEGTGTAGLVRFVGSDTATKGTWSGKYGLDGFSIINAGTNIPFYAALSYTGGSDYTWIDNTSDVRALLKPGSGSRIAACRFTNDVMDIYIALSGSTKRNISLYFVDWDSTVRNTRIEALDPQTGTTLDTRIVSSYNGGVWLTYEVQGGIRFKISNTGGANAVFSGVFFDTHSTNAGAPVAYWNFNEGSGTTAADSTGNGHTGTLNGGAAWTTEGRSGGALSLNGSGYVGISNPATLVLGNANCTVSAWIKTTSSGAIGILTKDSNGTHADGDKLIGVNHDGTKAGVDHGWVGYLAANKNVTDGAWHHIVWTQVKDGSGLNEVWKLYIDGIYETTLTIGTKDDPVGFSVSIGRGCSGSYFPDGFNGLIDEVRIYNRVLSDAEILALGM